MANRWFNTLKSKWRKITGAVAVLLMFFVPITRAVFANSGAGSKGGGNNNVGGNKNTGVNNNAAGNKKGGANNAHHSDRPCASVPTPPTPQPVSRVKPKSEKSHKYGAKSGGKNQQKPKAK